MLYIFAVFICSCYLFVPMYFMILIEKNFYNHQKWNTLIRVAMTYITTRLKSFSEVSISVQHLL